MGLKVWGGFFENPCHLAISRDPMMVGGQKFGHKHYPSYPSLHQLLVGPRSPEGGQTPKKGFRAKTVQHMARPP
jgi:hypothetical protein